MEEKKESEGGLGLDYLCEKCSKFGFTSDVGCCKKCGIKTSSSSLEYCILCAKELSVCQYCGKSL